MVVCDPATRRNLGLESLESMREPALAALRNIRSLFPRADCLVYDRARACACKAQASMDQILLLRRRIPRAWTFQTTMSL